MMLAATGWCGYLILPVLTKQGALKHVNTINPLPFFPPGTLGRRE
jgi:hypothetical protein